MSSEKRKQTSVRFEQGFYDRVENYRKAHGIKTWVKAMHLRDVENVQRIEELEAQKVELEKEPNALSLWLKDKGFSKNGMLEHGESNVREVAGRDSMDFSDVACPDLDYVKGKAVCLNIDSPIPSFMKRNLTARACMRCQMRRNKEVEKNQKEQKEKKEKALRELRRKVHQHQESVNKTVAKEGASEKGRIFRGGSTDGHW